MNKKKSTGRYIGLAYAETPQPRPQSAKKPMLRGPPQAKKKKKKKKKRNAWGTNSVGKIPARMSFTRPKQTSSSLRSWRWSQGKWNDPNTSRLPLLSGPLKLNRSHLRRLGESWSSTCRNMQRTAYAQDTSASWCAPTNALFLCMSFFFSLTLVLWWWKYCCCAGCFIFSQKPDASCFYEKFNTVVLVFVFSDHTCLSMFFIKRKWWY